MNRAVIFDLYETLITENHPERHSEVPPYKRLGLTQDAFNRERAVLYHACMTGKLHDYSSLLREICHACKIVPPEDEISLMQAERLAAKARPFERVDPRIIEMLQTVKKMGYRIGVISNCTYDEIAAWESSPLSTKVDVPIFSCMEGIAKPDSAIYKLACDRLDINNNAAVFVGDGGSDELRGAAAAGLKSIWATWFIEVWPWDWVKKVTETSSAFPRCRSISDLSTIVNHMFVW